MSLLILFNKCRKVMPSMRFRATAFLELLPGLTTIHIQNAVLIVEPMILKPLKMNAMITQDVNTVETLLRLVMNH